MSRLISLDTETYYTKGACSVTELGNTLYTLHPDFDCYLVSVCDGSETWVGHPRDFNWAALEGAELVSHNAGFDRAVVESLVVAGKIPGFNVNAWHCSANLSAYLCGLRSLGKVVKHIYNVDISKDMRGWMNGKTMADAAAAGRDKEMIEYARRDALWCYRLFAEHRHLWPDMEQRLSEMTIVNADKGIAVDTELLAKYRQAIGDELLDLRKKLPWMEEGRPPTSPKAIAERCRAEGIPCPPVKSHDEDGFDEWEATYAPRFEWVKAVADWRSVTKVGAFLDTMYARLRYDNTIETSMLYFGAHTGRWSGAGGINFLNLRKYPLMAAGVAVDVRRLLVPRPGKQFILCDLAQIEPRVLAWLVNNKPLLEGMRTQSVYDAYARQAGWWNGGDMRKEDPAFYALVKARVLSLGYGCGPEKFITMAATYGVTLDLEQSKKEVEAFRSANPLIAGEKGIWRRLDDAFKRSAGTGTFEMELPTGRVLRYRNVKRSYRLRTNPETGETERQSATVATIVKSGKEMTLPLYGGLLTENAVQAIAREVFATHIDSMNTAGIFIPFHVYDEAVCETDIGVDPEEIGRYMSVTPEWLPGCPIGSEAKVASYYMK